MEERNLEMDDDGKIKLRKSSSVLPEEKAEEEGEIVIAKRLVKAIVARGGRYSFKLSGCNAFVKEEDDVTVRTLAANKLKNEGKIEEMYTLPEFKRLLWAEEE